MSRSRLKKLPVPPPPPPPTVDEKTEALRASLEVLRRDTAEVERARFVVEQAGVDAWKQEQTVEFLRRELDRTNREVRELMTRLNDLVDVPATDPAWRYRMKRMRQHATHQYRAAHYWRSEAVKLGHSGKSDRGWSWFEADLPVDPAVIK